MGTHIENRPCPQCSKTGSGSSLSVYDDGVFCNECGYKEGVKCKSTTNSIFKSGDIKEIQSRRLNQLSLNKYNIQSFNFTGHFNKSTYYYDEPCVIFNYYENGKIAKQKIRALKDRGKCYQIGNTKVQTLFGMQVFTPTKKLPIIITEGEFDAVAVFQAMGYPAVAISGAQHAEKQISENIAWLSEWSHVVLCFDSDEAGQKAVDDAINLFEIGSVRVCHLPLKDANDMVKEGREEELKKCIWNAEIIKPSTIVSINDIRERVLVKPQMGIPWHYAAMNSATYGLMPSTIYLVAAAEGIGKTEFVKEMIFHVISQEQKVGIFSFEQEAESTVHRLIGSKLNKRLHIPSETWWNEKELNKEMDSLEDKLFLYDNKGSLSFNSIVLNIRYLVKCHGVKFIVIDNLTAMCSDTKIDNKRVSEHEYMSYVAAKFKSLVNELKISICVVAHLNNDRMSKQVYMSAKEDNFMDLSADDINKRLEKPGMRWESGRMPVLENIYGSGVIRKLADYIIVLARNKTSENPEEQRKTIVKFLKCRLDSAQEGKTFNLYYNYNTGRLDEEYTEINDDEISIL